VKRFRFNLEKVLELRKYREKLAEQDLAKVNGVVGSLENEIRSFHSLQAQTFAQRDGGRFDYGDFLARDRYYNGLNGRIRNNEDTLVGHYEEREKVLTVYKEKAKDRKIIDKLKDKKTAEYKEELLDEEQRSLDDLVNAAHHRRSTLGGEE
jgi:flagellar FliJ protein